MKTIVILRSGISGGTATLSLRIGKWFVENGYNVIYVCQEFNDINNLNSMLKNGIDVRKWKLNEFALKINELSNDNHYYFITYSLMEFLFIESIKNKIKVKVSKSILYVVHTYGLIIKSNSNKIMNQIYKHLIKQLLIKLDMKNKIVFMEESVILETEKYYNINIINKIIIRLPFNVNRVDKSIIKQKYNLRRKKILSITRAEFPFKGYIFGLIDDFIELYSKFNDLSLEIIVSGDETSSIYDKLLKIKSLNKNNITITQNIRYEELEYKLLDTYIYIGMGTSLLDACNNFVPAITIQPYTYQNLTSGYFYQKPYQLIADKLAAYPTKNIIERTLNLSYPDYSDIINKQISALNQYYSIDVNMNKLLEYYKIHKELKGITLLNYSIKIIRNIQILIKKLQNK